MLKTKGYAIFDLDYTLLPYDTLPMFANFIIKKYPWRIYYLLLIFPILPLAFLKWISSKTLKQIFLSFLWKMKKESLEKISKEFVEKSVLPNLYQELLREIEKNKNDKILILNTAAPDFYAKIIGEKLGFDYTIATPFVINQKINLFPKIIGENNKSYAKIKRLSQFLDNEHQEKLINFFKNPKYKNSEYSFTLKKSISYSDSIADLPLLKLTEKAVLINPDSKKLFKEATKRNWIILTPVKPYKNIFGKLKNLLFQCLGLF